MKNFCYSFGLVAFISLFLSCGKDDDSKSGSPVLLTVHVDESFLTDSTVLAAYVIASKADGTMLDFQQVSNSSMITLETDEVGIDEFMASLYISRANLSTVLLSYPQVPTGSTWWLYPDDFGGNPSPTVASAELLIEGTGGGLASLSPFSVNGALAIQEIENVSDHLKTVFSIKNNDPTLPVLAIYRSSLDDQVRYFFDGALPIGQTTTVQQADLPIIATPMVIDFGAGTDVLYSLSGVVQTPSNDLTKLEISRPGSII